MVDLVHSIFNSYYYFYKQLFIYLWTNSYYYFYKQLFIYL